MLDKGMRDFNRGFNDYRNIKFTNNFIPHAEGSVKIELGNTIVLAAVKIGMDSPMPDKPNEGNISVSSELLPMASAEYEAGPPTPESVEFARVVDRGIRHAEMIDTKSLFIEEGKVWTIFIDLYTLNYDGNIFDAGTLAAVAALHNTKMPKYEDGKEIHDGNLKNLEVSNIVTSCTFAKIEDKILLDPDANEERIMSTRLTIGNDEKYIRSIQQGLGGPMTEKELELMTNRAFEKSKELRMMIKKIKGD
jgi:exosome complex component RRP42